MRNIEIKVKLEDDKKIIKLLRQSGARFEGEFIQKDRFYNCPTGRLKLREIDAKSFTLIFYDRPNVAGSRMSEYRIVALDASHAPAMMLLLDDALGEKTVVKKTRELWLYQNTRIHIDYVEDLGLFLELETAVDQIGRQASREEHTRVIHLLGIGSHIPLSSSYADMLMDNHREGEKSKESSDDRSAPPRTVEFQREFKARFEHIWNMKAQGKPYREDLKCLVLDDLGTRSFAGYRNSTRIMEAFSFAASAHEGQVRKGTQIPYIQHPVRVAKILMNMPCSENVVIAGFLHDTLEDTSVTIEVIRDTFGEEVAAIVEGVSEPDKSAPWEDRKEHTIEHLRTAPMDVVVLACADKLDNLIEMYETHREIGEELWKRFKRPRDKQKWYYRSLGDIFKNRIVELTLKPLLYAYLNTVHNLFDEPATV